MRSKLLSAVVLTVTFSLAAGCDDFSVIDQFYRETGFPLAIYPANVALRTSESVQFVADGGAPDYTYRVVNAAGGEIDSASGYYVAPSEGGDFEVEVVDRAGHVRRSYVYVREPSPLAISPTSASVLAGATKQFSATGGSGEYSFIVEDDTLGHIDATSGLFTANENASTIGTTRIRLFDGVNTAVASVTVYSDVDGFVVVAEPPVIVQNESTTLIASEALTQANVDYVVGIAPVHSDGTMPYVTWSSSIELNGTFTATNSIGEFEVGFTNNLSMQTTTTVTVIPASPGQLEADGDTNSNSSIQLTWDYATWLPDIEGSGFRVERSTDTEAYTELATVKATERSYLDTTCSPSVGFYSYRVIAFAPGGFESAPSFPDVASSRW